MAEIKDITGRRFGRIVVVSKTPGRENRRVQWLCKCDCGTYRVLTLNSLEYTTKSCGCLQRELVSKRNYRHGESGTRIHSIWAAMRQRCNNPKGPRYADYGGRGISVCKEWDKYENFRNWALSNGYAKNLSIDRINNDGNYEPDNCRWATYTEQANNTRHVVWVEKDGIRDTLQGWSKRIGIGPKILSKRHVKHGLNPEMILRPIS